MSKLESDLDCVHHDSQTDVTLTGRASPTAERDFQLICIELGELQGLVDEDERDDVCPNSVHQVRFQPDVCAFLALFEIAHAGRK